MSSTQKLHNLWTNLNGAPKVVGDCLREIEILGTVIQSVRFEGEGEDVVKRALSYCQEVVGEFEGALIGLGNGLRKNILGKEKGKSRSWAKAKFMFKEKELG